MDAKNLRNKLVGSDNERAVSPVIGVILMVAVTVILAATIAMLVTDIGGSTTPAPTADLDATNNSAGTSFTIQHTNGDELESADLEVIAYDSNGVTVGSTTLDSLSTAPPSTISTGDGFQVSYDRGGGSTVAEIRIVHTPSDSTLLSHSLSSPIVNFDTWST